jgi:hypothetical protein
MKPLTPLSAADFCSPLDDAYAEITRLKKQIVEHSALEVQLLDKSLRSLAYRKFIKQFGLWAEFLRLNPSL